MRPITLGVDVDDTSVDLISEWNRRYNAIWNDSLTPDDWTEWDITKIVRPECGARVYEILKDPTLYDTVQALPGACEALDEIRAAGHRVLFVTSCGYDPATISASSGAKLALLQRTGLLPADRTAAQDFIVAADKTLVKLDLLIDDRVETIEKMGSRGIIFDHPHNRAFHHSAGYRVRSWDSVPQLVREYALVADRLTV